MSQKWSFRQDAMFGGRNTLYITKDTHSMGKQGGTSIIASGTIRFVKVERNAAKLRKFLEEKLFPLARELQVWITCFFFPSKTTTQSIQRKLHRNG